MWRVALVYFSLVLLGLSIVARIVYLQFVEVGELTKKAKKLSMKNMEIEPNRGDILATDGRLLATAVPYYEIRVDVSASNIKNSLFFEKIDSLSMCLSRLFDDKPASQYRRELTNARRQDQRYYLLKRKVDFEELKRMRKFPIFRLGKYKGGFIAIQTNVRFQPYGNMAARTIGYLSRSEENIMVGIEGSFNDDLKGVKGMRLMQRIPGNVWMPIYDEDEVEPKDGYDVVSTLDVDIQDVANAALMRQLQLQGAHHGAAILMEVSTGDVKAIVNLERDKDNNYREFYNYAIGESTEPGSTIKLATLMAAMEDGFIGIDDTINTGKGVFKVYDKEIKDHEEGGYGILTVQQILENSSNIGVAMIVQRHYGNNPRKFVDRLYDFGLNKQLGLQLKGEGLPEIKYPGDKQWSGVSLAQMSYGYELRLTPIQILAFYNAVANHGKMVRPRFVKELRYHGKLVKSFEVEVIKSSIASSSTLKKAGKMLEGVVETGTALNLKSASYKIAGKTGTAQLAKGNKGYRQNAMISYQASFVGYFPADNPKYSCIVVVNAPSNGVYYGNVVAGSVFKEIADKVYATKFELHDQVLKGKRSLKNTAPYMKNGNWNQTEYAMDELGIDYNEVQNIKSDWVIAKYDSAEILIANKKVVQSLVPDVTGMGVKDAVFLIENAGMRVAFNGFGKVLRQSVMPGSRVMKGGTVALTMSN